MSRVRDEGCYEVQTLLERLEPKKLLEDVQEDRLRQVKLINLWGSALLTFKELRWDIDSGYCPRNWLRTWLKAIVLIKPSVKIQEKIGGSASAALKLVRPPTQPPLLTGDAIQAALDAKGMTKTQLADTLQVDRSLLTRWLKGQRTIQPKHRVQIKALLGDFDGQI